MNDPIITPDTPVLKAPINAVKPIVASMATVLDCLRRNNAPKSAFILAENVLGVAAEDAARMASTAAGANVDIGLLEQMEANNRQRAASVPAVGADGRPARSQPRDGADRPLPPQNDRELQRMLEAAQQEPVVIPPAVEETLAVNPLAGGRRIWLGDVEEKK